MTRETFTLRVAEHFKAHPFEWLDARGLEVVGGRQAWRTRISDARRQFGMVIENKVTRMTAHDGTTFTISKYRYCPAEPILPAVQESLTW